MQNHNHFLWINIEKYNLDVGAVYRKPEQSNIKTFIEIYSQQLQQRKRAISFGDFNFNLLSTERGTNAYKELIQENGYKILNKIDETHCTRTSTSTKSIIDHICTNLKHENFHVAIIDTPMSDHKQIYLEMKLYQAESLKKLTYQAIDYAKLYKSISELQNKNEECLYNKLEEKLIKCINQNKITKTKIQYPPRQNWIKRSIINLINKRNELWNQHKKSPNDTGIKENFIKKRNEVSEQIQRTKSDYYNKTFTECKNQPAKMWQLINSLSCNKIVVKTTPKQLQTQNGITTNMKDICEGFNKFFASVGSVLACEITKQYQTPINSVNHMPGYCSHTLSTLPLATKDEVLKIIKNLKSNTSSGLDGINTKSIKCVSSQIIDELTNCINKCIKEGTFPDSLKVAKITPIYKSGAKYDPSNYRPISVLPVLSKIFERVLYDRLDQYLTQLNYIYKKQYGFRPKSNTLSATIDLITNIKLRIDKKQVVLGLFIDLKKAFDSVSHELLLKKLTDIGIQGSAYKIFKSYLTNRKQVVKIGEMESNPETVTYGIPQGSIIGPLLFLIHINGVHQIGLRGDLSLYADDTCIFYYGNSIDSIISEAQSDLDVLNVWFQQNLLTINATKTNYMVFAAKNKKIGNHITLKINDQQINKVNEEKYLGLILDSKMTWLPHIQKIKTKLTSLTGALRSIARCLPPQVRYTIYNALVKPHIDYLIEAWGTAAKTNLKILQTAQNKLIKVLFRYNYRTPTEILYKKTKLLNINQTYIFYNCILIRKILHKKINTGINLLKHTKIHKMKLRNEKDIKLYTYRTKTAKRSILYEGSKLYNTLPINIKQSKTMYMFKKLLKSHIVKNEKYAHIT